MFGPFGEFAPILEAAAGVIGGAALVDFFICDVATGEVCQIGSPPPTPEKKK